MPLFFEDLVIGSEFVTDARTITETDVVSFAALSGDWNQIHTDAEFARETPYGQRVAHGVLGLSVLTGLLNRSGVFTGSAIAMLGIEWTFSGPIFIGDTLHVNWSVANKRLTSDGKRGIVERTFALVNQRQEIVQRGTIPLMVRLRPGWLGYHGFGVATVGVKA